MKITENDKINLDGVSDSSVFEVIARLVDSDTFIEEMRRIRGSIGLVKPISYKKAVRWLSFNNANTSRQRVRLSLQLSLLKQKLDIEDNLDLAMKFAVLSNAVTDREIKNSVFCTIYPFEDVDDITFDYPVVAIFINRETKKKDITRLMDTKVKSLFKEIGKGRAISSRASPSMREVRDWYWSKKEKTYPELYDYLEVKMGKKVPQYNTLIKAIQRYRKKLL